MTTNPAKCPCGAAVSSKDRSAVIYDCNSFFDTRQNRLVRNTICLEREIAALKRKIKRLKK